MQVISIQNKSKIIKGEIEVPASKSLCNRLLILRELGGRKFEIEPVSEADDTQLMIKLLTKILDQVETLVLPAGLSKGGDVFSDEVITLDCGNAGTVFRFLAAFLITRPGCWILTGSERMQERPAGPLAEALRKLGARVEYLGKEGFPPLRIGNTGVWEKPRGGDAGKVQGNVSSQFFSALEMIGPYLENGLAYEVEGELVSRPYLEMTRSLIKNLNQNPGIRHYRCEGDWSSAAFWYAMVSMSDEADLTIKGLYRDSLQGDSIVAEWFEPLGVRTEYLDDGIRLTRIPRTTPSLRLDFTDHPDLAPAMAVCAAVLNLQTVFTGLSGLAIKESDRLAGLIKELSDKGFKVMGNRSELFMMPICRITVPDQPVKTYGDHRMAMAFAALAMQGKPVKIEEPEVVTKSYPGFWKDCQATGFTLEFHPEI